jgi:Domain of unknown function (DUF4296)
MKKYSLIFGVFFMFSSCGNSVLDKPDNLIDDDKMIEILTDLSIMDALKSQNAVNGTLKFEVNDYVFKKYKIDSLQFAQSNKYYASDVPKYKRMYKIVNEKLTARKTELDQIILKKTGKQMAPSTPSTTQIVD